MASIFTRCCDVKTVRRFSNLLDVIAIPLHVLHIGFEIADIANDSFMTHTYSQDSDDKMPTKFNKYVYGVTLATVIIGAIFAIPKTALSILHIHKTVRKKDETASETKATVYIEFLNILLESLPQAIIAQFFLNMCPESPFHFQWLWLFKIFVSCTIEPPLKGCLTFIFYLSKKHIRMVKTYLFLCVTGIALGLVTVGFGIAALTRDIETTCLFIINANATYNITNGTLQS